MNKTICFIAIACFLTLASCDSGPEDRTERVEEEEDMAAEAADEMEDAAEERDTSAVQNVQ